jgi:ubiquinone/menaquinone biosynthesis C-methylase UbiE
MNQDVELKPMSNLTFRLMEWVMSVWDIFVRHPEQDLAKVPLKKGLTVVDYACGPGHYTIPMAEKVGPTGRVYAVDIQPLAMETVARKAGRRGLKNITTVLVDSYDTGLPAACADIAVFLDAFHMVGNPEALLREIQRLLKPEGLLFMDPGHLKPLPVLRRVERTGLFTLVKRDGDKMLLSNKPAD